MSPPTDVKFQSTSSVWRTTTYSSAVVALSVISIHVLRVEDDHDSLTPAEMTRISIHVLRVEDD